MKTERIIKAAIASQTITTEERRKLEDMQLFTPEYVEPGYTTDKECIILGDYNPSDFENGGDFERACNLLEKVAELEWDDEWTTCGDCGGLVRASGNSYDWTPHYVILNDCGLICLDCLDTEDYLEDIKNDHNKACLPSIDPTEHGYTLHTGGLENGLHEHMTDDPEKIVGTLPEGVDFVFKLDYTSQFNIGFSVYVK